MITPLSRFRAALWASLLTASAAAGAFAQVTKVPTLSPQVGSGVGSAGGSIGSGNGINGGVSMDLSAPTLGGTYLPSANGLSPVTGANGQILPAAVGSPADAVGPGVSIHTPSKAAARRTESRAAGPQEEKQFPRTQPGSEDIEIQYYNPKTGQFEPMDGGQEGGIQGPAGDPDTGTGAVLFDGAAKGKGTVDVGGDRSRAPPKPAASADPLGLFELLNQKDSPSFQAGLSKSPDAYKKIVTAALNRLKSWKSSPASAHATTKKGASVQGIIEAQTSYKETLLAAARDFTRERGIDGRAVISNGTSLEALLGILFSGSIQATNPHKGFSGETAEVWGAYGLEGGASYGAKRGVARNEPGVMILIQNKEDPITVVEGETMSRTPYAKDDFLGVIITDGRRTVVLDRPLIAALSQSSALWKDAVTRKAHAGDMSPFYDWERYRDRFEPE